MLLEQLLAQGPAVLVRVAEVQGSGPREVGAWMAVGQAGMVGSIGGGQLEFDALAEARAALKAGRVDAPRKRYALGPSLGQCCGGVVHLDFEWLTDASRVPAPPRRPVALFGGGHVGRAIARLCVDLPFALHWIDSRDEIFPTDLPTHIRCEHSDPVQRAVADLTAGSQVLIMSFSHAEDLDIVAACLARQRERADLPFIGLIGSKSKWAAFRHRLEVRGFAAEEIAHITSPIGIAGIAGKQPEVIAISAVAQLLQLASRF
ncbi:MAG TPA: xanthine dehydrogenase accessory protein XdhC [Burkholderiaceae bacterium]